MGSKFSNMSFYSTAKLTASAGTGDTLTITNDIERDAAITLTDDAQVLFTSLDGSTIERMTCTATGGTLTIVERGLDQSSSPSEVTALMKEWKSGTLIKVVQAAADIVDVNGDNDFTGDNTFTGAMDIDGVTTVAGATASLIATDAIAGFGLPKLTTTERLALTPVNGYVVHDETIGVNYQYIGGAWSTFATGAVVNGSTTVAGKFEEATVAEQGTATATGGTGARLVMANENLVKASSGVGDENKVAVLNASGQFASGFIDYNLAGEISLTAGETTAIGDLIAMESDGSVYKTLRSTTTPAQIGSITGIDTAAVRVIKCEYLDDDTAIIVYVKSADDLIYGTVVSFARGVITAGAEALLNGADALGAGEQLDLCVCDTGLFVIAYESDADGEMKNVACTVSGTTITAGAIFDYGGTTSVGSNTFAICKLGAAKFMMFWKASADDDLAASANSISGTTITKGTVKDFTAAITVTGLTCHYIEDDVCGMFCGDGTNIYHRNATVSALVTTQAGEATLPLGDAASGGISNTSTSAYIGGGRTVLFEVSARGTIVVHNVQSLYKSTFNNLGYYDTIFAAADVGQIMSYMIPTGTNGLASVNVKYLGDNKIAIVSQANEDGATDDDLQFRVMELGYNNATELFNTTVSTNTLLVSCCKLNDKQNKVLSICNNLDTNNLEYSLYQNTENQFIGMATEVITATNPVIVKMIGNATSAGLTAGQPYYVGNDGAVATSGTKQIGVASTTTNMILK